MHYIVLIHQILQRESEFYNLALECSCCWLLHQTTAAMAVDCASGVQGQYASSAPQGR